jgi:integrase
MDEKARATKTELGAGIRREATSWQVFACVKGRFVSKRYPLDTPLAKLPQYRAALIAKAKAAPVAQRPAAGATLAEDAAAYLDLIRAMASFQDQAYHIGQWAERLGHRTRKSLTSRDLREQLEHWRRQGRADGAGGLANSSLNRRRTALMALYTMLDGKSAVNIVKDVPTYDERDNVQIRAQPIEVMAWIIRHTVPRSKTRARLRVLQWTGWPAQLVMEITYEDVDWRHGTVRAHRRKKGKGMPEKMVPVVPRALIALRQFFRLGAEGRFSTSSMHKSFAAALAQEQARRVRRGLPALPHVHPYTLRHTFGTWAAKLMKDDRTLREMLRTNSIDRYTEGTMDARMTAARDLLAQALKPKLFDPQLPSPHARLTWIPDERQARLVKKPR